MENKNKNEAPTRAYSVPQAREQLGGISHCHFYKLVKEGHLRIAKAGRRTIVTDAAIRDFLANAETRG